VPYALCEENEAALAETGVRRSQLQVASAGAQGRRGLSAYGDSAGPGATSRLPFAWVWAGSTMGLSG